MQQVSLVTSDEIILLDVRSMKPVEQMPLQTGLLTAHDFYSGLTKRGVDIPDCFAGSVCAYREKLFLLVSSSFTPLAQADWAKPDWCECPSRYPATLERPDPVPRSPR